MYLDVFGKRPTVSKHADNAEKRSSFQVFLEALLQQIDPSLLKQFAPSTVQDHLVQWRADQKKSAAIKAIRN